MQLLRSKILHISGFCVPTLVSAFENPKTMLLSILECIIAPKTELLKNHKSGLKLVRMRNQEEVSI